VLHLNDIGTYYPHRAKAVLPDEPQYATTIANLRQAVTWFEMTKAGASREQILHELAIGLDRLTKILKPYERLLGVRFAPRGDRAPPPIPDEFKRFAQVARKLIDDHDALFSPARLGVLRVKVASYPSVLRSFVVPRVLPALFDPAKLRPWASSPEPFSIRFPSHRFDVTAGSRSAILGDVVRGALDFAILDRDKSQLQEGFAELDLLPLFSGTKFGFLCHKSHPILGQSATRGVTLATLLGETIILNSSDNQFLAACDEAVEEAKANAKVKAEAEAETGESKGSRVHVNTYALVYAAVAANTGIGLGFAPSETLPSDDVRYVPLSRAECKTVKQRRAVEGLEGRGMSSFCVYLRRHWDVGGENELSEAARFALDAVIASVCNYTHDYVTSSSETAAAQSD